MKTRRIDIIGLRTWGQLGNYLAAKKLGGLLAAAMPDCDIEVHAGEQSWPILADFGAAMARAVVESTTPDEVARRYGEVVARISSWFPPDAEHEPATWQRQDLVAPALVKRDADVIIAVKGIVSRMAHAATRTWKRPPIIVNHVTNHGLLELPIHCSTAPDLQLVPLKRSRALLVERYRVPAERIHVVGAISALRNAQPVPAAEETPREGDTQRPRVVVFSNRGGELYLGVLEVLARHPSKPEVMFVAYGDPELARKAEALAAREGARDWLVRDRLEQDAFHATLARFARFPAAFVVTKSGPNTMFEAARMGLPLLVHRSGLPMEDWVSDFIREHALGQYVSGSEQMIATLQRWLDDPAAITQQKQRLNAFSAERLEADAAPRIVECVRSALAASAAGTPG